ncbi:ATP-dependent helicase [Rhizobium sp. MHM7A]|uniref:ATP-dependent helicase n=1 Tax=Rhizobium sp. MHM7A TaxID=2583233 RepID=UPI001105C1E6|nr:ATP-dependent helicase [Rhizobium sp. MHM7A]TLX16911.1 ATP-dependent helicase [Rhizobium sp. MHM7A]
MARLNSDQVAAATHKGGHAIVLAGPGTGKTSTLIARHAFLCSTGVDPDGIVAISFTKDSVEEIRKRLGERASSRAWIGTFHALCLRLLKRFNVEARLSKNFKVLDPSDQRSLFIKLGIDWDQDDGDLSDIIGRWKDSLVTPDEADAEATRKANSVLRKAAAHYAHYEEALERLGHLDFSDLLVRATEIIEKSEKVKSFIRERMPHFLVDEFQDVNRTQVQFLFAVTSVGSNLWAVADDDQAIYGWRGGKVEYTVNFRKYFPNAKQYFLMTNYRCDPAVIATANTIIANNKVRVAKNLKPGRQHKQNNIVRVRSFATDREEAEWLARVLKRMMDEGANPREIGVLFRTASVTAQLQQAMEKHNVPFALSGTASFWELPEVQAMTDLLVAIERGDPSKAGRFKGARDLVETMKGSSPIETAMAVARVIGDNPIQGLASERQATWIDTCYALADIMKEYETAEAFKAHVVEMSARATAENAGISVTTIHSSKGLEWRQVFVIGCEASMMPHHRAEDIEEERRLFYVAITRTKGAVDLSTARTRFGRAQTPSPFLAEVSKAPNGAFKFIGDDWNTAAKPQPVSQGRAQPVAGSQKSTPVSSGPVKTYILADGRRSLIPPEERD